MTIQEIQNEIIEEFDEVEDWMDRYQMLIDLGEECVPLSDHEKTTDKLIDGCQSRVWIVCEPGENNTLLFRAESDALIVKGLISLLLRVVNHQKAADIVAADFHFIAAIGLSDHLSPTRSNGLLAMIARIKAYARAYAAN